MSVDVVAFLRARYDDDERVARQTDVDGTWELLDERRYGRLVISTARVLREVEAKRWILVAHEGRHYCTPDPEDPDWTTWEAGVEIRSVYPCGHLRALAAAYCDHLDYNPDWSPS